MNAQLSFLSALERRPDDGEVPSFDSGLAALARCPLGDGAWFAHHRGWVRGTPALFSLLEREVEWAETTQTIYDKEVVTPRLVSASPGRGRWPFVDALQDAVSRLVDTELARVTFALYRHGNDSVAWHRDRLLRDRDTGWVVSVSLGAPRAFQLRPRGGPAATVRRFVLGPGDLFVMGGTCQRTWEHTVPKAKGEVAPRIVIMFRAGAAAEDA